MLALRGQADVSRAGSLSNRLRSRRFARFADLAAGLPSPLRIIDIGGTQLFWEQRGWADRADVHITTINLTAEPRRFANIESRVGNATDLVGVDDGEFDVAFSNSVIEHLFTYDAQRRMAREVQRVARAFWVQTPNFWFPVEPHFHTVGWQWLPVSARAALIRKRAFGWRGPEPDPARARRLVEEVRLLSKREMRELFPEATIWAERVMGLAKSWVAYAGFPPRADAEQRPSRLS